LKVTFHVDEGPTVKVGQIDISKGTRRTSRDWVVWQMAEPEAATGFRRPLAGTDRSVFARSYDVLKLADDKEHIRIAYLNQGYFKAKIGDETVKIVRRGGEGFRLPLVMMRLPHIDADITIHVDEGPQYHLRNVYFQGITLFKAPDALMRPLFKMGPGDVFSADKLKKGMEAMRKLYGSYRLHRLLARSESRFHSRYQPGRPDDYVRRGQAVLHPPHRFPREPIHAG
jgi:outer membrane protein insertion porin family